MSDAGSPPLDLEEVAAELLSEVPAPRSWTVVAVGWATVELERAAAAFVARWPWLAPIAAAPASTALGARACVARARDDPDEPGAVRLVLLEPSTEGRIAASLARHGEGPAAVWLAAVTRQGDPTDGGDGRAAPSRTGAPGEGPLGPERLLPGAPIAGPHVLLLDRPPGTIDR